VQEVLHCDYCPKEITEADIKDYLRKEESHDTVWDSLEERLKEGASALREAYVRLARKQAEGKKVVISYFDDISFSFISL
jgi:hypothetical protein